MDCKTVKEQALEELADESFRRAVEIEKERLRKHRPFWNKVFPWKITITRR